MIRNTFRVKKSLNLLHQFLMPIVMLDRLSTWMSRYLRMYPDRRL